MELRVVEYSREPWMAHTKASILESAGLHPVVFDNHLVQMDWFLSQAVGGVRVLVPEEESNIAKEILENPVFTSQKIETGPFIPSGQLVAAIITILVTQSLCAFGLMALIWKRYRNV